MAVVTGMEGRHELPNKLEGETKRGESGDGERRSRSGARRSPQPGTGTGRGCYTHSVVASHYAAGLLLDHSAKSQHIEFLGLHRVGHAIVIGAHRRKKCRVSDCGPNLAKVWVSEGGASCWTSTFCERIAWPIYVQYCIAVKCGTFALFHFTISLKPPGDAE
jgi:hypothetical protein